jgi:hypothetical protein
LNKFSNFEKTHDRLGVELINAFPAGESAQSPFWDFESSQTGALGCTARSISNSGHELEGA